MWDEEKLRIGGSPPPPPPEPTRTARPLCQHIEVVRAQLQVCFPAMLPSATLLAIVEAKLKFGTEGILKCCTDVCLLLSCCLLLLGVDSATVE